MAGRRAWSHSQCGCLGVLGFNKICCPGQSLLSCPRHISSSIPGSWAFARAGLGQEQGGAHPAPGHQVSGRSVPLPEARVLQEKLGAGTLTKLFQDADYMGIWFVNILQATCLLPCLFHFNEKANKKTPGMNMRNLPPLPRAPGSFLHPVPIS